MKLLIKDGRAVTDEKPPSSIYTITRMFEGRKSFLKDGQRFSFEDTQHNISLFLSRFPDTQVVEDNSDIFEAFAPDLPRPKFKTKRDPLWWQAEAFEKLKDQTQFGLFYDPGGGKSKSLTDIGAYKYCKGEIDAMIIIPPNMLVCDQWAKTQLQRDIHDDIPWSAWLWGKTKKVMKAYEDLKTFNGLQIIVLNIDAGKTPNGKKMLDDFIKHHKGRVLFAIDESHLIKNPSSARHKAMMEQGGNCDVRAILTGTPIAKDLVDIWAQLKFLNERIIGIRYKTAFMSHYCETRWNGFGNEIVGHKNVDQFYDKIDPFVYRITQKELGLERMDDDFEFSMSDEQKKHFNELKKLWLTSLDNGEFLTAANAMSATIRMQQVTNGYLRREDGSFQLLKNNRMEALNAWLETISDDKIVIWCRFKQDALLIMENFDGLAVDISGNVDSKQRIINKDRFISDSNIRFTVGTPDAAGTGMDDLQKVCNRALRYSYSENSILHWQSDMRTSRVGGKSTTSFYTDLICRGSGDKKIIRNLKGKTDLAKMTLDDVRNLFGE